MDSIVQRWSANCADLKKNNLLNAKLRKDFLNNVIFHLDRLK